MTGPDQDRDVRPPEDRTDRPWRVLVMGVGRGPMQWSTYATGEEAETAARKLRAFGFHALAVGSDP